MRFLPRFRTALTLGWPLTSHRCDPKTQTSQILTWSGLDHTPLHLILLLSSPCPVVIPHSVSSRTHHRKNSDTFILLLQPARPPSITIWTSCSVMPESFSPSPRHPAPWGHVWSVPGPSHFLHHSKPQLWLFRTLHPTGSSSSPWSRWHRDLG